MGSTSLSKPSPDDCFKRILEENYSLSQLLNLALKELLEKCKGDSAIRNEGRAMLPRFCWAGFSGSYPKSDAQLCRAANEKRLHTELHNLNSDNDRSNFAQETQLAWVVNLNDSMDPFDGERSRERLKKAADHFLQHFGKSGSITRMGKRVAEFLNSTPFAENELTKLRDKITEMDDIDIPTIPRNKKSNPDRTEALLLFNTTSDLK